MNAKAFEPIELNYDVFNEVDYVKKEKATNSEDEIIKSVQDWSARKRIIFQEKHIRIKKKRLKAD